MSVHRDKLMTRWMELQAELRQLRTKPRDADRESIEEKLLGERDGIEALSKIDGNNEAAQ
jgi:hypothetical protein